MANHHLWGHVDVPAGRGRDPEPRIVSVEYDCVDDLNAADQAYRLMRQLLRRISLGVGAINVVRRDSNDGNVMIYPTWVTFCTMLDEIQKLRRENKLLKQKLVS